MLFMYRSGDQDEMVVVVTLRTGRFITVSLAKMALGTGSEFPDK